MKQCPICDTPYPDEHATCDTDGAVLIQVREWSPGTLIRNKYRILAKIGQGGMGTMYKAQHLGLDEVMGLKVMASDLLGDPSFVKRFRQEARAARKVAASKHCSSKRFRPSRGWQPFHRYGIH